MNYYLGGKCLIFLFIGLCFFSLCHGNDNNCTFDGWCPSITAPCKGHGCLIDQQCAVINGKPECRSPCQDVECPMGTFCFTVNPTNCMGSTCTPYAVCKNPCDNVTCPEGDKCYAKYGVCPLIETESYSRSSSGCIVTECKFPCDAITCPPFTGCSQENQKPTCQNPCMYRICIPAEEPSVCCSLYNGASTCRIPCPDPCDPNPCRSHERCVSKPVCCDNGDCCPEACCRPID